MFKDLCFVSNDIYDFLPPTSKKAVGVLSIPHAGEVIPQAFKRFLTSDQIALMEDVDYRVHSLVDIDAIRAAGIAVIIAKVHRYCVDLNRPKEIAVLNWKENTKGLPIVMQQPDAETESAFLAEYYTPYYQCMTQAIKQIELDLKRKVPFIDLHSMPSRPTAYHMKLNPNQSLTRADFCLSDLPDHRACVPSFIQFAKSKLEQGGYSAAINEPYQGGYITKYVDTLHTDNIQIEINRAIYMDEVKKILVANLVEKLKPVLTLAVIETLLLPEAFE